MPAKYCFEIIASLDGAQKPKEAIKKFARVFINRSGARAIAVGMHMNENDLWYEDDAPTVLNKPFAAEDLGQAISQEMAKTDRRALEERDSKLTDWPAFKASGERSVRRFAESYIEVSVEGANASNLVAVITGSPNKDALLQIRSTISTGVVLAELGERVLQVYEACRDRRF